MHMHVGVIGSPDRPQDGFIAPHMSNSLTFDIFLLYTRVPKGQVDDVRLFNEAVNVIAQSHIPRVVCLALDAVYDEDGRVRYDATTMFVPNAYILKLRNALPDRILFGASVHPYDPNFQERVSQAVEDGAVLLKWLPSAQQIDLADERVKQALVFLATVRGGAPLPLLLHVGTEGAIISTDSRTMPYDFLTWTFGDRLGGSLPGRHWRAPDLKRVHANLEAGLNAGACIIFAHCGLPYFAPRVLGFLEHSDFDAVATYVNKCRGWNGTIRGKAFADVSACVTPVRQGYFDRIRKLPPESVLFGSDFPVPIFELSADVGEHLRDFRAVLKGDLGRIVIPQGNLLDVNLRELQAAFPGHAMFTNALQVLGGTGD